MACAITLGQNNKSKWSRLVEQHQERLKKTSNGEQKFDTIRDTS
jgi:hypothetical protein